ncbi:hypothetical protein L3Q82_015245, partial [Scortum barcoo]
MEQPSATSSTWTTSSCMPRRDGCKMLAGKANGTPQPGSGQSVSGTSVPSLDWKSQWATPPKVVENDHAKVLWDFQIQTDN